MWKDIIGYENHYQVNELGQIRTLKDSPTCKAGTVLKSQTNHKNGYVYQMLYKDGKQKLFRLHRLVAIAFLPNPYNYKQINHINGDKTDNRVENLEWCSQEQNMLHAYKTGLEKPSEKQKKAIREINKLKSKPVIQLKNKEEIATYCSISEASRVTGVSIACISRCCNGRRKSSQGFEWRFQ